MDKIPKEYHVIAHDHLGFGHSDKPVQNDYLISNQADYANALYDLLGAEKLHIVAHDYGTSVATEIIARDNVKLNSYELISVTLCNGSMLIEMARLRIIQRLLKSIWFGRVVAQLSTSETFHKNMSNIWFRKNRYQKSEMNVHWELLLKNNGKRVLPMVTRYIDQRYKFYDRWIGGLRNTNLPIHILWAENDPVAIVDMAYKLDAIIKYSQLTIIAQCGHYPMIEKDKEWLGHVLTYIQNQ
jgi:pimeloyl-ACP methyl ester carboxylesterase